MKSTGAFAGSGERLLVVSSLVTRLTQSNEPVGVSVWSTVEAVGEVLVGTNLVDTSCTDIFRVRCRADSGFGGRCERVIAGGAGCEQVRAGCRWEGG